MTIATGLALLGDNALAIALEEHLAPRLAAVVGRHGPGHCMRCDDLDTELAARLCRRLRSSTRAQVHVLGTPPEVPDDVAASSTKIVELRNPAVGDELRPPLLVFVPPGTRASAEDSFGVATFEQITFGALYDTLADELLSALPEDLVAGVEELFAVLRDERWRVADGRARCRYLLTIARNDHDQGAAGAAVCELGMIPDPVLFTGSVTSRTAHNLRAVRQVDESPRPDRARVLELGLTDPGFRRELAEFAARIGLSDPLHWTRLIVTERENWRFFFSNWSLREDTTYDEIGIEVEDIDLPTAGATAHDAADPALRGITGQRYLPVGNGGLREITVGFRLDRDPRQVSGLARFRVQLMAEHTDGDVSSGTPTEIATAVKVSTTAKLAYRAKLRKVAQSGLEEGWHYVRVTALDSDGLPIGQRRETGGGRPSQESERFYVLPDGDHDGPPPPQRTHRSAGVTQAARAFEFAAAAGGKPPGTAGHRSSRWQDPPRGSSTTGPRTLVCDFGTDGLVDVAVSAHLAELQQRILADPSAAGHWELALSVTDAASSVGTATVEVSRWADQVDAGRRDAFLAARAALFTRIARPSSDAAEPALLVEACDLLSVREQVISYADSYAALLDERHDLAARRDSGRTTAITALADLTRIDTVTVTLTDHRDAVHEIVLVAPTHPLRILWLAAWALIGHRWADAADRATAASAGRALLRLQPLGHPLVIPRPAGRLALAAFDLTPYWGVCLPDGTADPQGLMALLQTALGVPRRESSGDVWSGAAIADRFELYLSQHLYVRTLLVNAVNIGRGEEIAQAVRLLRTRPGYQAVEFDLRLYVGDPEAPGSAEAILELLDGPDALPQLSVSVRGRTEFHDTREDAAHLTVLFDALSAEHIGTTTVERAEARRLLPVHGLVQEMLIDYTDDPDSQTVWRKRPRIGVAWELDGAEEVTDVLSTLPASLSSVAATLATGQFVADRVPEVSLTLTADDSGLLDHAHRCSDWVITVDRTLGIEFFDNPRREQRPDYVIDYAPETGTALGHHMVVSSRSLDELRTLLTPILRDSGLDVPERHVRTFFDQLRLLSGRLAFKIASVAPHQRTEVLGLALARLYLEGRGTLSDQILVPLDAHLDLYDDARSAEGAGGNLRRTDLALFDVDPAERTLTCRLVEVKCYSSESGISGYQRLKDGIRAQLGRSADVLTTHFDPTTSRPDRVAKNYELAGLLRFYLDRALRHGVVTAAAAARSTTVLDSLDGGYGLRFTRSALVFDLTGRGSETEIDGGVEFSRIGRDVIQQLLDAVPTVPFDGERDTASKPAATRDTPDSDAEPPTVASTDGTTETAPPPGAAAPARAAPSPTSARTGTSPDGASVKSTHEPDIVVGASRATPQFGIIGETAPDKLVAIDLNETHTVSLFGVQGGGKSYTLGTLIEAATLSTPPLNQLGNPLATIVFHYSATQDYAPEFTSMTEPNDDQVAIAKLRDRFGVAPRALTDVVLLAPRDQCDRRREQYPGLDVRPLAFSSAELQATHWRFLMGAVGNQATYVRQLNRIMKSHRDELRLDVLRAAVEKSSMADHIKQLALQRLELAGDYIDDEARVGDLVVPGRLIIVDLRDELIEKDEALGLFVVLMQLFADARGETGRFNKLVVFDEAHKYIDSPDLVRGLVESVREMRHKGMSVLVASQDPPSVPVSLIELSDHIIVHKCTSPAWLRHLQKANSALATVTADRLAELRPGEAYLWASKSTDPTFTERMVKIRTRPRLTRHGGGTRTATGR